MCVCVYLGVCVCVIGYMYTYIYVCVCMCGADHRSGHVWGDPHCGQSTGTICVGAAHHPGAATGGRAYATVGDLWTGRHAGKTASALSLAACLYRECWLTAVHSSSRSPARHPLGQLQGIFNGESGFSSSSLPLVKHPLPRSSPVMYQARSCVSRAIQVLCCFFFSVERWFSVSL